ncbi:hypothetical protein BDW42DRAFT_198772 [Aspergillus taichungensis]|uniref:Uncharacterized protein n=1 Tax=Aspergillus taichungensis TaxID=482145 RepID=A0A2J5HIT6_9EURO|nr:hypothetical protein BDW42DRAFT_198772 [Aspergillus taichungensis]
MQKYSKIILFSLCLPSIRSAAPQHQEPCAVLGDLTDKAAKVSQLSPKRPGDVAYNCLQSIPFESDPAFNIDIPQDPPPAYPVPGAVKNFYHSQFDFDSDIVQLILAARDERLSVKMCTLKVIQFTNNYPLFPSQRTGLIFPRYTHNNSAEHVSLVMSIDGVNANEYLEKLSRVVNYNHYNAHDPDALYNILFPSNAHTLGNRLWPGLARTLKFKDSTKITVETLAELLTPLTHFPWRDGPSLYDKLCVDSDKATEDFTRRPESVDLSEDMSLEGYPKPFSHAQGDQLTGYLPDHPALQNTAVLSVPSFITENKDSFARAAKNLINNATAQVRRKMIIDICSNGGGSGTASLNLFKLVFPEKQIYTASRYRAHEDLNLLEKIHPKGDSITRGEWIYWAGVAVTPDMEHNVTFWEKLYGHDETVGTKSSILTACIDAKLQSQEGKPVCGYGPVLLDLNAAAFKAEDILFIMLEQNAKTIAFGGRPQKAKMQTISAVRGGINARIEKLSLLVTKGHEKADELQAYDQTLPTLPISKLGLASTGGFDVQSTFSLDDDQLPMQFTYEPAGCRRFYTVDNVLSQESVWADASKAVFENEGCVQ